MISGSEKAALHAMPALNRALLGPWDTKFKKKGWKANYVITKDKNNGRRIRVKSCQWKGCDQTRSAILKPSTDVRYPATEGWFTAKSIHKPDVDLFVKKDGDKNKVVYENRTTKEKIDGEAAAKPATGKN